MFIAKTHHGHCVQLLERAHGLEKQDNHTTSFDSLNGSSECVGSDGFEILENTHAVGVTQNLLCFLVVGISNIGDGNKELERIFIVGFSNASLDILLNLCLSLFPMTSEGGGVSKGG